LPNAISLLLNVQQVHTWVKEDTPGFDFGGYVVGEREVTAFLFAKSHGYLAGIPFVEAVFEHFGVQISWEQGVTDGMKLEPDSPLRIAVVKGPARFVLLAERMALELIVRASSIATHARRFTALAQDCGWTGRVAGTRKTAPGLRMVDKYALIVGGADTHRMDLSSMVMLKDNHIDIAGSIESAVSAAKSVAGFSVKVEVEARSEDDAVQACRAGADVVMLDNFQPADLKATAARLKGEFPHVLLEGSGGIRLETIADFFCPHIDVISIGRLTQSLDPLDFSLKIQNL